MATPAGATAAAKNTLSGRSSADPDQIIKYYAGWAAASGVIPAPFVDMAAVTAVQVKMLKRLAKAHGVDYDESSGRSLLGAVVGAALPAKLGYGSVGSLIKALPGVGGVLGIVTMPGFNYASTYAVGRVFTKHFASGGTLLSADRIRMKNEYDSELSTAPTK